MRAVWGGGRRISQITLKIIELNKDNGTSAAGLLRAFNIDCFLCNAKGTIVSNIFNHGILLFLKHAMGKVSHEIQFGKCKGQYVQCKLLMPFRF